MAHSDVPLKNLHTENQGDTSPAYKTMNKLSFMLICTTIICANPAFSQTNLSTRESDYYKGNVIGSHKRNFFFKGTRNMTDTNALNSLITSVSNRTTNGKKGGTITIKKPNPSTNKVFLSNVQFKNNVHIKIASNVTVEPYAPNLRGRPVYAFRAGSNTSTVSNFALTSESQSNSPGSMFKVSIPNGVRASGVIELRGARNFLIAGIDVTERDSILTNIEMNLDMSVGRGRNGPRDGVIKNIRSRGNNVGYGMIQTRIARRVLFKNLDGAGGATLRWETGIPEGVATANASLVNLVARNITSRNSYATIYMAPHRINQGIVDARNVKGFGAWTTAFIVKGFLDNKGTVNNVGRFNSNCYVQVSATKGNRRAQVTSGSVSLYPNGPEKRRLEAEYRKPSVPRSPSFSIPGRSLQSTFLTDAYTVRTKTPPSRDITGTIIKRGLVRP